MSNQVCMVNIDHPCHGIDVWNAESDEDVRLMRGQGYVPLDEIRKWALRIDQLKQGYRKELHAVEQALGVVLGYPRFCDDQKNFPGSTEADGVCIGEHVASTIAIEAAERIRKLEGEVERLRRYISCVEIIC